MIKSQINKKYVYNFKNKVVIITGASSGLGYEISKRFLKSGASLMICSSNSKKIKKAFDKLKKSCVKGQKIIYMTTDVASATQVKKLISYSIKKYKKIDILINNAGIYGPKGNIEKINWNEWVRTIEVNLLGSVMLCKNLIPHFKRYNKGKIIQLSGGGAASPIPNISGYAASKAGIVRFVENLSSELKDYNIDINAVAPGAVNTNMLDEVLKAGPDKIGKYYYKKALIQKKKGGSSIKTACDLILFLASNYSNGIKGKLLSALWDDWNNLPLYKEILKKSDVFALRRITALDRGYKWGHVTKKNIYDRSLAPRSILKKK